MYAEAPASAMVEAGASTYIIKTDSNHVALSRKKGDSSGFTKKARKQ
jgi:hypothetical protein